MDDGHCKQNVCHCDNGIAASLDCASHEAKICVTCDDGYYLSNAVCEKSATKSAATPASPCSCGTDACHQPCANSKSAPASPCTCGTKTCHNPCANPVRRMVPATSPNYVTPSVSEEESSTPHYVIPSGSKDFVVKQSEKRSCKCPPAPCDVCDNEGASHAKYTIDISTMHADSVGVKKSTHHHSAKHDHYNRKKSSQSLLQMEPTQIR